MYTTRAASLCEAHLYKAAIYAMVYNGPTEDTKPDQSCNWLGPGPQVADSGTAIRDG